MWHMAASVLFLHPTLYWSTDIHDSCSSSHNAYKGKHYGRKEIIENLVKLLNVVLLVWLINLNVPSISHVSTAVMKLLYLFHTILTNSIHLGSEIRSKIR